MRSVSNVMLSVMPSNSTIVIPTMRVISPEPYTVMDAHGDSPAFAVSRQHAINAGGDVFDRLVILARVPRVGVNVDSCDGIVLPAVRCLVRKSYPVMHSSH